MPPHSQTPEERELSEERIKRWGAEYIGSAERSLKDAKQFASKEDWFTAYTYLFIAFNNLYCWHSKFHGDEREKIKAALKRLPGSCVNSFYDNHYVSLIRELNDRTPEEFGSSAEVIEDATGILKMR